MTANQLPISLKDAKASLGKICDAVTSDRNSVLIKVPGRGEVAVVRADELSALMETLYLLNSPKNAARLLAALSRARRRR